MSESLSWGSMSRRHFIGVLAAGSVLGACSDPGERPQVPDGGNNGGQNLPAPSPGAYRESPMLAARVSAGELPPIIERLPKEPFIVRPGVLIADEDVKMQPGKFGGTLQIPTTPEFDSAVYLGSVEPLLWTPTGVDFSGDILGNVLAGWEGSEDARTYTFNLREGLRWSDGELVSIEDVRFAFEDVLSNEAVTPVFPSYLRASPASPPPTVEYVDDYTFSLTFDKPYGSFPASIGLGGWRSYSGIIKPRHYLEKFHEKYASKAALAKLMKEASIPGDQWFNLFNARQLTEGLVLSEEMIDHPTLTAWTPKQRNEGVTLFERNPYYFKIDAVGSQLPYVDELRSQEVQDAETLIAQTLFGAFDYSVEWMSLKTLPRAMEKVESGEAQVLVSRLHRTNVTFWLNLTHPDPTWRSVVHDVRFRKALSFAINRQEILDEFYLGQFAELPKETNPPEFDPDEASRLLDEMGLDKRDSGGFRLGPDGKRFTIPLELYDISEDHPPMSELMAEYWKNVGVYTTVRIIEGSLWHERTAENEILAGALFVPHDLWNLTFFANEYLPLYWGVLWNEWYNTGGSSGEEPPQEIKDLFADHDRFMAARIGTPESDEAFQALMKNHRDNVWIFNPVEHVYYPCMWTSRVKNIPVGIKKEVFGVVGNLSMEQWYVED